MTVSLRTGTVAAIAAAAAMAACATGPAFEAPLAPQAGEAVVYLYRASAIGGSGIAHDVWLDGRAAGKLVNGSYLRIVVRGVDQFIDLRLAKCRRLAQPLLTRPGDTLYVQAQLVPGTVWFGGKAYFDFGCQLVKRSEAEAMPAITGLRRAD